MIRFNIKSTDYWIVRGEYFGLIDKVQDWLDENNISYSIQTKTKNNRIDGFIESYKLSHLYIIFKNKLDAMAFKLKWM